MKLLAILLLLTSLSHAECQRDERCGLKPIETGCWDPHIGACERHDEMMQEQIDSGELTESIATTQLTFVADIARDAVLGVYAVATAPLYILIGAGVGTILQVWRLARKREED